MVLLSLSTKHSLQYIRIFKHSGLDLIWLKWFINTLPHKYIQHIWHPPSCSSGCMRKHAFLSIFVVGHQRIILTGVLPVLCQGFSSDFYSASLFHTYHSRLYSQCCNSKPSELQICLYMPPHLSWQIISNLAKIAPFELNLSQPQAPIFQGSFVSPRWAVRCLCCVPGLILALLKSMLAWKHGIPLYSDFKSNL